MQRIISQKLHLSIPAVILAGCALFGGGPDDRVNSLKRSKDYTVKPPTNWSSIDRVDSDSAYRTSAGNIVTVTSSCDRDSKQPLELLTRHLLIGARKIQTISTEHITVSQADGLYSHVQAQLEGRPFELHLFVASLKGCIFDFSLVSPSTINSTETLEFKTFLRSFQSVAQ